MLKKTFKISAISGISLYGTIKLIEQLPESQLKYDVLGLKNSCVNLIKLSNLGLVSFIDYSWNVYRVENQQDQDIALRLYYERLGKRMYNVCSQSRGILIKGAQYLSNLERILPKEITNELKLLQDQCPFQSLETIKIVIQRELTKNYGYIIQDIEPQPLGAASIAQVHKGTLFNGQKIAIKVQHPELNLQYELDLYQLEKLVELLTFSFNKFGNDHYNFNMILNKFKTSLADEIDFKKEAKNSKITEELFKDIPYVKIPKVYDQYSTSKVLLMEYVEGINIDENQKLKDNGYDLLQLSELLIKTFSRMIFENGHVHCDAHAGNIFVRKNPLTNQPQIILLDHGFYKSYPQQFRQNLIDLWIALINQDHENIKIKAENLGLKEHYHYLPLVFLFKSKKTKKIGEKLQKNMVDKNELTFQKLHQFILQFPDDFLLILRTINLIAIRNSSLGGTTRKRLFLMTNMVYQIKYPNFFIRLYYKFILFWKIFIYENLNSLYQKLFYIDPRII